MDERDMNTHGDDLEILEVDAEKPSEAEPEPVGADVEQELPLEDDTEDLAAAAAKPGLRGLVEEVKEADAGPAEDDVAASVFRGASETDGPPKVAFSWFLPALILLIVGLPALGLAIGNGYIAAPALRGMRYESQKRMNAALDAYAEAFVRAGKAEETRLGFFSVTSVNGSERESAAGFSVGSFAAQRIALLQRRTYGPLESAEMAYSFMMGGARIPKRMEPLVAEFEEYYGINEEINQVYAETDTSGEDGTKRFLEAMLEHREKDSNAAARAGFYDYYICLLLADDPERFSAKVAELKAAGQEPWTYEPVERYVALKAEDYAAVARIGRDKLARDAEDAEALTDQARALWLQGKKNEAYALAEAKQNGLLMRETAKLAKAELLYRDGKYDEAIALCDEVIDAAKAAPGSDSTRGLREAQAATAKAIALLLADKAKDAAKLLRATIETEYVQQGKIPMSFYYAILAACYKEDQELYRMTAQQLEYNEYAIPQEIQDLHILGTVTVADIYQTGWGVIS